MLYAIVNQDGEFVTGGTSRSKRHSKKPHVYTTERNAKLGLRHVEFKEDDNVKIVPYVPLDDLMKLAHICEDMFPYAGTEADVDVFLNILNKYGYVLSDDGLICAKEDL